MGYGVRRSMPQNRSPYIWYALGVLVLVYVVNFVDRQILSILAEDIKADLGISDAQLGFLYGTAFAIFYAVFGIPLARLSDGWVRKNVIAMGLAVWSLMTALSGTARSFLSLGAYRIGVGVGESSATPAAYSMITDYFPERLRATAMSIYAGGVFVGQGLGLFLGGWIVDSWNGTFEGGVGWFGLRGWQAAFFTVGVPGLLLAVWVATLREPVRGGQDGIASRGMASPLRGLLEELAAVIPPITVWSLVRAGADRRRLGLNFLAAGLLAAVSAVLIATWGNPEQWIALAIGVYAFVSWAQGLELRDRPVFELLFRSSAMRYALFGFGVAPFVTYSFMFWTAPYLLRAFDTSATEVGLYLAVANIGGGAVGVVVGGLLSDWLKHRTPNGRLYVVITTFCLSAPLGYGLVTAPTLGLAYAFAIGFQMVSTAWSGTATAVVTELVLPRMRAIAAAILLLMYTFVGLAMGPFVVGRISDALAQSGVDEAQALGRALAWSLLALGLGIAGLVGALRHLPRDERTCLERARAAGEPV